MKATFGRFHGDDGYQMVIAFPGRKRLHMVTINPDLQVMSVPIEESKWLAAWDQPKLKEAVKRFRDIGRRLGASQRALSLLKEAA